MSDELKAAAEAVSWIEHNRHTSVQWDLDAFQEFYERDIDALLPLARAYLADLAAREAEERERALPIDEVWLRPLCRSVSTQEAFWFIDEDIFLVRWAGGFNLKMNNREIAQQATRGDLLDLLAGLKINTKGGAE